MKPNHALLLALLLPVAGCDLLEADCDPEAGEYCPELHEDATSDAGGDTRPDVRPDTSPDVRPDTTPPTDTSPTDTADTAPRDCPGLAHGATRCASAAVVEICDNGTIDTTDCETSEQCVDGDCVDVSPSAYRFLRIIDLSDRVSGPHPGADIDGIELLSGGQSFFGGVVADSYIPPDVTNNTATRPDEALGEPEGGQGSAHACDVDANPAYWVSLGGSGELILAFENNRGIADGDTVRVYECGRNGGGADEDYFVAISTSDSEDAEWIPLLGDTEVASGYWSLVIDFDDLGI